MSHLPDQQQYYYDEASQPYVNKNEYNYNTGFQNYPSLEQYPMYNPNQAMPADVHHFPTQPMFQDPALANMAMQYGGNLLDQGAHIVQEKVQNYVDVSLLKYYFCVNNSYVGQKLLLLFFPFSHKHWAVAFDQRNQPVLPKEDVNAPDLYIPLMSLVTYIITSGFVLGLRGMFSPEQLGMQCSSALAWLLIEILFVLCSLYVTQVETTLKYMDVIAYSAYKFANLNIVLLAGLLFSYVGYYITLLWCSLALGYFLVKTLRLRVQSPQGRDMEVMVHLNKRRTYLLLLIAGIQPLVMWWLSSKILFSSAS